MLEERSPADFNTDEEVVCALFPHREKLLQRWRSEVEDMVDTAVVGGGREAQVAGPVFEFAVGFDLSTTVPIVMRSGRCGLKHAGIC